MSRPILWHLPLSHYSEKVRWALAYKSIEHERREPVIGYHMALALALTRGRVYTLPVLELDGRRIGDSTAIIAALEQRYPTPPLYPEAPDARRRALELEDWFDEELGPYIRRVAFHALRSDREQFAELARRQAPAALARYGRLTAAYARAFTATRFLAGSDRASAHALDKVVAAFDRLESELAGNDYLVGARFTVADLTAAALFYPLVLPPEGPLHVVLPPAAADMRRSLEGRSGYRWVEEIFRRHRPSRRGATSLSWRE